ncbi:MAG: hypothetical protein AUK47_22180 [Deltaproteobacteria bacterium CG2_30_63_29]|nr:MAG: hypothetical protein AUK47_22180 [Deltaproteobacteria bacterium CG2_30_63_29]PJB33586.1 MAG: sigma-54-dependent Fis family transcriptional regulator [Deltaproteobacteria bacterium CG_4_9_14_3_um_filter_63_12]
MMKKNVIAVVEDDSGQRQLLISALTAAGYETIPCGTGEAGLEAAPLAQLMLLDVRLPGINGLEVLERVNQSHPQLLVILLTAYIDVREAVVAIKSGALDYLEKPIDLDELVAAVDDALGTSGRLVSSEDGFELPNDIIVESAAMRQLFRQAYRAAISDATVLILGQSGTGKDVLASFIHSQSQRARGPFVRVNCGALPEHLIESELFGHERGAFTGANSSHKGRFEEADGGTLFLDEIGELPLQLQPKLLHVLEGQPYRRLGGNKELKSDLRLVSATNKDLEESVAAGTFREDLYYRLNVVALQIPPLKDRRDDILPLAEWLIKDRKQRLSPAAERTLMLYDWPGNVRELKNGLERASIMANGSLILPTDLPAKIQNAPTAPASGTVLVGNMQEIQRRAILEALEKTGGNKTRAAALLNISRRNLIYKLREYGL